MDPREQLITQINQAVSYVKEIKPSKPLVGLVLGSGMSSAAGMLQDKISIPYSELPHFPEATTTGHEGCLTIGDHSGTAVAAMQGRFHLYEGYTMWGITLPIRVLARLGCKYVIVTNCAGGTSSRMKTGTIMLIKDHINLMGANPLTGPKIEELGERFIDMTEAYDPGLRFVCTDAASSLGIEVLEGVYAAVSGPSYETPGEVKFLASAGADAVGMSTVPEVIVARQQQMKVLGISVITNNLLTQEGISHKEVLAQVGNIRAQLEQLLALTIKEIGEKKDEL